MKEQRRRVFTNEFRNTHFSYIHTRSEQFVSTPELHSDEAIESELPLGQVWAVSPGSGETGPGPEVFPANTTVLSAS